MSPNKRRRRRPKRVVGGFVDQLVFLFFILPLIAGILWASGQDPGSIRSELGESLLLLVVLWGIAGLVAWRAGGLEYMGEQLSSGLVLVPFLPWVLVLFGVPAPSGDDLAGLVGASASFWVLAAVLRWRFQLWPFESREVRGERHPVSVFHIDPPDKDYEPYFLAMCDCGWIGDFHDAAEPSFADARKHSPQVEPEIQRPLDPDYVPRPSDSP